MRVAAAALLYLVLAAVFLHHELVASPGGPDAPASADLHAFYFPQMRYAFAELRAGRLPLWNPHQGAGTPLLAHPAIGFFYPLYAPFLLLVAESAVALHIAVHLALAALFTSLCCRAAGLGTAAAVIAGIAYAFQGSMRIKLYHPTFLIGAAAIPLLFWLVLRLLEAPTRRRAAALGLGLGVALLGSELQFLYFATWALLPLVAVHIVGAPTGAPRLRSVAMLAVAAALGTAIGLVRIVPGAAHMAQSWRPPGGLSLADASIMSLPPATFVRGLLTPRLPADTPWWDLHGLQESYLGVAPLILAGLGLLLWPRRRISLPIAAAGIGAVWYAAGADSALYRLLLALPGGDWFRGPDRALIVTGFAAAFLCGAGVEGLGRLRPATALPPLWRLAAVVALAFVIFVDLTSARALGGRLPGQLRAERAVNQGLFDAIARRQGYARTYIGGELDRGRLSFKRTAKAGTEYGLWLATDYDGQCGRRLCTYLDRLGGRPINPMGYTRFELIPENRPLADLMGIHFYALEGAAPSAPRFAPLTGAWREVWSDGDVRLFESETALPRAFVVPRVDVMPDAEQVLRYLAAVDPSSVALVEAPIPDFPAAAEPGEARIAAYEPNRVVIDVDGGGGLLVLTDQFDRWWDATLDGQAADIVRADYLFRGVVAPPGAHRIEFRYRPWHLFASALASAMALALTLTLALVPPSVRERAGCDGDAKAPPPLGEVLPRPER